MSSDREQAIKDAAIVFGVHERAVLAVLERPINCETRVDVRTKYAVSQRERVIALERALRGLDILLDFGDIIEPNTAQTFDDPTSINAAFAAARAALNDK